MNYDSIPPALQTKLRVSILAALYNGEKDFNTLKDILKATDGNLSVQLTKLEQYGCIVIEKSVCKGKSRTVCRISEDGRRLFAEYVALLAKSIAE